MNYLKMPFLNTLKKYLVIFFVFTLLFTLPKTLNAQTTTPNLLPSSFQGIALKEISKSETIHAKSHKHEFHGVSELKNMLGNEKKKFNAKFIYMDDDGILEDTSRMTWYYIQPKSANGKKLYYLYYKKNEVIKKMYEGDLLFIGKVDENNLLVLVIKKDSKKVNELLLSLNIDDGIKNRGVFIDGKNNNNRIEDKEEENSVEKVIVRNIQEIQGKDEQNSTSNLVPMDDELQLYKNTKTNKIVIVGKVTQIKDGDTIKIADLFTVRLYGIDTPEKKQTCKDKRGRDYNCGIKAKEHLQKLIGKGKITCINEGNGKYGRFLFVCSKKIKGKVVDINGRMVSDGWAVAEYSKKYKELEKNASDGRVGIWSGEFVRPREWRHGLRIAQ